MNYFLTLIIIMLGMGGYFEYTQLVQQSAADRQQVIDLGDQVTKLKAENAGLSDAKISLAKSLADAQVDQTNLNKQLQAAQSALADAKSTLAKGQPGASPTISGATPGPAAPSNSMGTIATLDGKTYQSCQLLKVQAGGIIVNHSAGITEIVYGLLPPDLQKRFGYDPHQGPTLAPDQVETLEDQRKAAGGN